MLLYNIYNSNINSLSIFSEIQKYLYLHCFPLKIKRGGRLVISKLKLILIMLVFTILLTISLISAIVVDGNVTVNEIKDCYTEFYDETEDIFDYVARERDVYGSCIYYLNTTKCNDEPFNTSCYINTTEKGFQCAIGKESYQNYEKVSEQIVQKNKTVCTKKAYTIDIAGSGKKIDFAKSGYYCNLEGNILTCDSVHDGDGNGVCHPGGGETCIKFELTSQGINTIHKRIGSVALKDIEIEDV